MVKKLELLAPAGSPEKMRYAFAYGADAVYMGIPDFSLRVRINKFTLDDVRRAIEETHKLKKKIYVTVNIYAHNEHLEKLPAYLKKLNEWKPDGLLVSDPGILQMVKKYAPNLTIHLSTQANATNWQAVKFWYEQGVKRVVLGREVTLTEIKEIHKRVPKVELEYFIHGAMCMSYSGRCMLSAWLTGRSANLGDCVQPCRWKYNVNNINVEVEDQNHPGMKIPVEEDKNGTYIFNSKDMCLIEYLKELIDAGVVSLKIEGRAKSPAYLATVVKAYRLALDSSLEKKELKKIKKKYLDSLMTRGYTTGFLFGRETVEQNTEFSHIISEEKFVGEVVDCLSLRGGGTTTKQSQSIAGSVSKIASSSDRRTPRNDSFKVFIKAHNALHVGDRVKIIQPKNEDLVFVIKKLYNSKNNKEVGSVHGGVNEIYYFVSRKPLEKQSIIFKCN